MRGAIGWAAAWLPDPGITDEHGRFCGRFAVVTFALMALVTLVALLWSSVSRAQSLSDAVTGGYSPVASRYQWGSTGGDLPTSGLTVLADCDGDALHSATDCRTGAAWIVTGAPALVPSYWRPVGGALQANAVRLVGGDSVASPTLTYGSYCVRGATAAGVADVSCYTGGSGAITLSAHYVQRVVVFAESLTAGQITRIQDASFGKLGSLGEPLTVTRASAKSCSIGGQWFTVPANQPCIGSDGLSVEGSRTNYVLQSEDASAWADYGTPIVTTGTWAWAGGTNGDTIEDDSAATSEGKKIALLTTGLATTWTASCHLKAGTSSTARIFVNVPAGGTGMTTCMLPLSASETRGTCSFTVGGTPSYVDVYLLVGSEVASTGTINVAGCQVEAGSTASSYIPTTTTPVTRAADVPVAASGLSGNRSCVSSTVTPSAAWNSSAYRMIWSLGAATGANRESLAISGGNNLNFTAGGADGLSKYVFIVAPADSAKRTVKACNDAGTLSIYVDGYAVETTPGGGGTGAPTMPATLNIGTDGAGANQLSGATRDVLACNTAVAGECMAQHENGGAGWPAEIEATVGNLVVTFAASKTWTIHSLTYAGKALGLHGDLTYYGSVFSVPGVGFVGSGHSENGDAEQVIDLSLTVDGAAVSSPAAALSAASLVLVKKSRIREVMLLTTTTIDATGIAQDVVAWVARGNTQTLVYHFMLPFSPTSGEYLAKALAGTEVEGTLTGGGADAVSQTTQWTSVWSESLGVGGVVKNVTQPAGVTWKSKLWDVANYRKYYFQTLDSVAMTAGTSYIYRFKFAPFAATQATWKDTARSTATAMGN